VIGPAEVILILIVAALLFAPEILKALWDSLK
jgi:Sec-independent protein translocase protein TatA